MKYTGQIIIKHAGSQLKTELFECDGDLASFYEKFPETIATHDKRFDIGWKQVGDWSEPDDEGIQRVKIYNANPPGDEAPFALQFSRKLIE